MIRELVTQLKNEATNRSIDLTKHYDCLDLKFQTLLEEGTYLNPEDFEEIGNVRISNGKLKTALKGTIERTKIKIENNMSSLDKLGENADFREWFSSQSGDLSGLDSRMKALEQESTQGRSVDGDTIGFLSLVFCSKKNLMFGWFSTHSRIILGMWLTYRP